MLTPEKRAAETAETARIHRMGEISVLANVSSSCSAGLTAALRQLLDWALLGGSEDAAIILNTRFLPAETTPQMVQQMLQALLAGKIPGEEWWAFLKQNEVITTNKDWPDAQAEMRTSRSCCRRRRPSPRRRTRIRKTRPGSSSLNERLECDEPGDARHRARPDNRTVSARSAGCF